MRKIVRTRIFTAVLISLVLVTLILLSSFPGSPLNHITSPFSAVFSPVQSAFNGASDKITGFWQSLTDGISIRNKNEQLIQENAALRNQVTQLQEAGRQYEELKNAFQLKDEFDRFEIIGARVMTREVGSWFDVIKIDLGTRDGLIVAENQSFAVVDSESRLVGRVLSSDLTTSKVLPLLHEGFSVSARIDEINGAIVRLRGDIDLKSEGLCVIDQIPASADIRVGDKLKTSGLGGLFPAGIEIGKVVEIKNDSMPGQYTAIVEPVTELDNISVVFVMKGQ